MNLQFNIEPKEWIWLAFFLLVVALIVCGRFTEAVDFFTVALKELGHTKLLN